MRFDFVRLAVHDVDSAAIAFPIRNSRSEMLVRICDALEVIVFVFVVDGVGRGISPEPEGFDELLALFIGLELLERRTLFVRDDVGHVFIKPASQRTAGVFLFPGLLGVRLGLLRLLLLLFLSLRFFFFYVFFRFLSKNRNRRR